MNRADGHGNRGLTLVEMLITLVVLVTLVMLGVVAFQDVLRRQRLLACVSDFRSAIRLARADALRRGQPVQVVPADGRNWSSGWQVQPVAVSGAETAAGDPVLGRRETVTGGITIAQSFTDSAQHLTYNASGRSSGVDGEGQRFGRLRFTAGTLQRDIVINAMGQERICQPADSAGESGAPAVPIC